MFDLLYPFSGAMTGHNMQQKCQNPPDRGQTSKSKSEATVFSIPENKPWHHISASHLKKPGDRILVLLIYMSFF